MAAAAQRTYLELSEEGGGSHKFYEVSISGSSVTVRYGRIGTEGQTQTRSFADATAAAKHAEKLIGEKTKKGYVETATA